MHPTPHCCLQGGFEILSKCTGKELVGLSYEPLFSYFKDVPNAFRVVADSYVTDDSGTGIVHQVGAWVGARGVGEEGVKTCIAGCLGSAQRVGNEVWQHLLAGCPSSSLFAVLPFLSLA